MPLRTRRQPYPRYGQYGRYRGRLREDFDYRCAYCDVHEAEWGGYRHFQIEHFRPRKLYPWLEAEYTNLLYACDVCNCFKGSDWPSDNPQPDTRAYLDPCLYDFAEQFAVHEDGAIEGATEAARYMVEALHLNRPQLKLLRQRRRREEEIHSTLLQIFREVETRVLAFPTPSARERVLSKLILQLTAIYRQHLNDLWARRWTPPYDLADV